MSRNKSEGDWNVAVLMATYNGGKFLREQLNSLIEQIGVKVTILVRDDGSTDNTTSILDEFQNNQLLTWYTGEHLNAGYGFLDLMKNAPKADYYAFCDQDDVWECNKLIKAIEVLEKAPKDKCNLYGSGLKLVNETLDFISEHQLKEKRTPQARFIFPNIAGCTMVFNQKLLDATNKYHPQHILMHDAWICMICLGLGGNVYVDKNSYIKYRQHGNNVIGLRVGIKDNLRRAYFYIFNVDLCNQFECLLDGYGQQMIPEFFDLAKMLCLAKKSLIVRWKLIRLKQIDFYSTKLSLTFIIKILLGTF